MSKSWRNKKNKSTATATAAAPAAKPTKFIMRDLLLPREIQEVHNDLPATCEFTVLKANDLSKLQLIINPPDDSMWSGGSFKFSIDVPPEYNSLPPKVRCQTRIYHPNIKETGEICLSILRQGFDETSWMPTRTLKDVIFGLYSLFTDLLNFEDPLNHEAAEHYSSDPNGFTRQVKEYIRKYCYED